MMYHKNTLAPSKKNPDLPLLLIQKFLKHLKNFIFFSYFLPHYYCLNIRFNLEPNLEHSNPLCALFETTRYSRA